MGKHSQAGRGVFWRSIVLGCVKWLAIISLPIAAAFVVFSLVKSNDPGDLAASPTPTASTSPTESASPTPVPSDPSPSAPPALSGKVQVLNGGTDNADAKDAVARLSAAGLDVFGPSDGRSRPQTTVFYHPGAEEQARAVADFLNVTKVEPAPKTLDPSIPVTVVTGADYKAIRRD
ncbi:MAG: LytR C-terminal domain-containing protein [Actinomycetota bacterium]